MNGLVRIIGSFVVSIVLYSVPILHVLAFMLHWGAYIIFILSIAMAAEIVALASFIYDKSGDGE